MSGDRIFITTGKPKPSAAATASSALCTAFSGAALMPASASSALASASSGLLAGSSTGFGSGGATLAVAACAEPSRSTASSARTARQGSLKIRMPASS